MERQLPSINCKAVLYVVCETMAKIAWLAFDITLAGFVIA